MVNGGEDLVYGGADLVNGVEDVVNGGADVGNGPIVDSDKPTNVVDPSGSIGEMLARNKLSQIAGPPLSVNNTGEHELLVDKIRLLEEINMMNQPKRVSYFSFLCVELLIFGGFALRCASIYTNGQYKFLGFEEFFNIIDQSIDPSPVSNNEDNKFRVIHTLLSHFIYLVLTPQAFLLRFYRQESSMNCIVQLLIYVVSFSMQWLNLMTTEKKLKVTRESHELERAIDIVYGSEDEFSERFYDTILQNTIEEGNNAICQVNRTCMHLKISTPILLMIFFPLIYATFRTLYSFGWGKVIEELPVVGPVFAKFASSHCGDFIMLVYQMMILIMSTTGLAKFSEVSINQVVNDKYRTDSDKFLNVALDLVVNMVSLGGGLGVVIVYLEYHNNYSHGDITVNELELEHRLECLVNKHRDVLTSDLKISKEQYFPMTCDVAFPVESGQKIKPRNKENQNVVSPQN